MSSILAIDPGMTTGWVFYDSIYHRVYDHGQFREHLHDIPREALFHAEHVVIEKPVAHGATRPQVVDCAFIAGHLCGQLDTESGDVELMTRREVCKILTDACSLPTKDRVRNDATAWAALKMLHGPDCDKRPRVKAGKVVEPGGCLGTVKSHERAALAVAVAYALQCGQFEEKSLRKG